MTEERKKELKGLTIIMEMLSEEYGPIDISENKIKIWDDMLLREYGIEKIRLAATQLMKQRDKYNKGFPKIFEIIEFIRGKKEDFEDLALQQCMKAKQAIIDHGSYASVKFDDCLIHKTIEAMGGWQQFCLTELKDWTWKEKEFVQKYLSFKRAFDENNIDYIPSYLPGIHAESTLNKMRGYAPGIKFIETGHKTEMQDKQIVPAKNILAELAKRMS
jgi:hypothetical protein